MSALTTLACADADLLFQDWGQPALLEEVRQYYDPESGELDEALFTCDVRVIIGNDEPRKASPTAARTPVFDTLLLMRASDVPPHLPLTTARLRLGETLYEIRSIIDSVLNGVLALECVTDRQPAR